MDSQIQLSLLDMLFINYAVEPDRLRPFVPAELTLDTFVDAEGRAVGFVSVVAFRVADVRSGVLPLPSLSFDQINFRAYVTDNYGPAVYFFAMQVNSRLVASTTSFLRMPVSYEKIEILTAPVLGSLATSNAELNEDNPAPHSMRYTLTSSGPHGVEASVRIGEHQASAGPAAQAVPTDFITARPIGYATVAGDSLYKITADHEPLDALSTHVESVEAQMLSSLGIMNLDETARPHSVLYVREALFKTKVPRPVAQR